tara:strand:+ start:1957 stop:4017 length:2061 start_codon:yes stop_codon:yes gene_type:complete
MSTPATRTPIKLARGSYSNLYASIDDLQEGEIIYAEDQNQLYVKEGSELIDVTGDGGGGDGTTNLSYTTSGAGLSVVSSSGSNTDLPAATTSAWGLMTDEDKTKLDGITASANNYSISSDLLDEDDMSSDSATKAPSQQSVKAYVTATGGATNLSNTANGTSLTVESSSGNNTALPAATTSAWGVMTDEDKTKLDGVAASANNYTHPNHSGEVTSTNDGATVIASNIVDEDNLKISNSPSDGKFLQYKDGTDELTWAVPTDTNTTYSVEDGGLTQNNFTNTLKTKLDGIEASADVTDSTNVNSAGAVMNSDLDGKGEILIGDGSGDPTALAVGTNNYVLTADSGEATGVKWAATATGTPEGTAVISTGVTGTTKFLRVDGDGSCSWQVPPDTNTQVSIDDTPVNGVTDEAISSNWAYDHNAATGNSAHVPAAGSSGQFLKHDGTWGTPPDTNTQVSIDDTPVNGVTDEAISSNWAFDHNAATGNSAHVPAAGSSGQFLKHDATWGTPPDTNTQLTTEQVQDIVGGMFTGNTETNISATYEDGDGTIDLVSTDTNTQLTEEQVEDFVGGMVTGNTETGITVTYEDSDGTLDFVVADQTPEGTAILSTGESGGSKFLREDGDGTCSWQTVSGGSSLTVQDEGSSLSTAATTLNFVGDGVAATGTGATKTITISGGGGTSDLIEIMMFT